MPETGVAYRWGYVLGACLSALHDGDEHLEVVEDDEQTAGDLC